MSDFRNLARDFKDLVDGNPDTETIRRFYAIGAITFDEALRELAEVFEHLRISDSAKQLAELLNKEVGL